MDSAMVERVVSEVMAQLAGGSAAPTSKTAPACSAAGSPAGSSGKQFITADALAKRIAAGGSSVLELAVNEHLTPAAQDLVARKNLRVRRAASVAASPSPAAGRGESFLPKARVSLSRPAAAGTGPVGLVLDRPGEKTEAVLRALGHDGIRFTPIAESGCWMVNLQALCEQVAGGALACGVALLPYAANAMVLANKIAGVRAVQATRVESVAGGIRHIGANVLVAEHRLSTFHELRSMTRTFVADRMICGAAADVVAYIRQLEGK